MTSLKLRVPVPFPSAVDGAGPVTVTKESGNWTVGLDYRAVAEAVSIPDNSTSLVLIYDTDLEDFRYASIDTLGAGTISTNVNVESLAGLTLAANKVLYSTGLGVLALADFTAAGRSMVAAADATAQAALLPAVTISGHAVKGGDTLNLAQADITGLKTTDSPTFAALGNGTAATTQANTDNSTKIATTAFVKSVRLDQFAAPSASVAFNSQKITGLSDPASAQDAATKNYVDAVAQGMSPKPAVLCATTANISLTGEQTIDGVVTSASRVLVKNQSTASQNGIYVSASGAWTRATDMDAWTEVPGAFAWVEQGTINGDTGWVCTSDPGGTLGSTSIAFSQFGGVGTYTAGTGLAVTGTQFAVTGRLLSIYNLAATANRLTGNDGSGNPTLITLPAAGLSLSGGALALANDLSGLEGLAGTGFAVRTASDTWAQRSVTAGAGIGLTNGDGVSGNPVVALSDSTQIQMLLNSMANARSNAVAQFFGMGFADSFGATTYYDSGNSTNVDTGTTGLLKPTSNVQIPQSAGTVFGTMTGNGGLAAAFDGVTSQVQASSASNAPSAGYVNTVGKDWGSGVKRIINEVKLWGPSDNGINGPGVGATVKIQGSNDNSTWTDLYTSAVIMSANGATADINSGITQTTAYRYHRVNINGDGVHQATLAEVQFFASVQNATIRSTAISTTSVPSLIRVFARVKHVDTATAGTDYTLSVSRDGGTTFTTLSLSDLFTDPTDSAHVIVSAECDVSGQPSGSSVVLRMDTANSKMVELRDWGFFAR